MRTLSAPIHASLFDPHGGEGSSLARGCRENWLRRAIRQPARLQLLDGPVAELDRDPAGVQEVELLLLVVKMAPGRKAGRQDDCVYSERRYPQRRPYLAEAGALAEVVEPLLSSHAETQSVLEEIRV